MNISEQIIEEVRRKISFVDFASEFLTLKRSGKSYMGICPFHAEKTPSFHVNEEEGLFHCFGCGEKGSIFTFVMKMRGLSFPESVRYLANKVGVRIPDAAREDGKQRAEAEHVKRLRGLVKIVAKIYIDSLNNAAVGRAGQLYLAERRVLPETIANFSLGFSPDRWEFIEEKVAQVLGKSATIELERLHKDLQELGLIRAREGEDGRGKRGSFDVFRQRIIFPITRSDGAPIAFGARLIAANSTGPKYLNSPESKLYLKRRNFFGLSQALSAIRTRRHVYIVEGYLDVLAMHQMGLIDVLASCGTALTDEHVLLVRRLVDRVTLLFDGDSAGRKAAANCFPIFLNSGIDTSVCLLEDGEDPDSLARSITDQELYQRKISNRRVSLLNIFLEQQRREVIGEAGDGSESALNMSGAALSGKLAQRFVSIIAQVQNPVEKELLLKQGAEFLGTSFAALSTLLGDLKPSKEASKKLPSIAHPRGEKDEQLRSLSYKDDESPVVFVESNRSEVIHDENPFIESRLGSYYRGLVVAVLCEPRLCADVLRIQREVELVIDAEKFPESVIAFFQDLNNKQLSGLSEINDLKNLTDSRLDEMRRLLERHRFDSFGLLEEAIKMVLVGGGQPLRVVAEASQFFLRKSLQFELQTLRNKEVKACDAEQLQRIVQEKLEKKRNLERIGGKSTM